jgi:hypothetical protein
MNEPDRQERAGEADETAAQDAAPLPEAARRALEEAAKRRETQCGPELPREINGRDGPEPVRYGDWEKNGIASDF